MKIVSKSLLLAVLLPFAAMLNAQPSAFVEGTHYERISDPVRTADPNKVEVAEVFWYGCPHCYSFEPLLESWSAKLPSDVEFVRSPGMWNELMQTHARIFYAAEALGALDQVHEAAFEEIHQRGNYLQTEQAVKELFTEHGVDAAEFDKAWNSFAVTSAVKKAGSRMRDYGVRGVPNLIVNGKYRIGVNNAVKTQEDMLRVAEYLIEQERG